MLKQLLRRCFLRMVVLVACGCGGGASPAGDAGRGKPTVDSGPTSDPLFTSADVPRCKNDFSSQYQLIGRIGEEDVRIGDGVLSNITPKGFEVFAKMSLAWTAPIAEGIVVDLVGVSMTVPTGHSLAGESLCITAGRFGSPTMSSTDSGRQILFTITGALRGGCSGTSIPISLNGCVFHTNTYFPNTFPKDASAPPG